MYRINIAKVRGKMGEKGYNISTLANSIEINRNTMAEYMRNPSRMPYRVIERLAAILCESKEDAGDIFLTQNLRKTQVLISIVQCFTM